MGAQAVRLSNVDIDNALKNKEFEVLFQPIFDLGNGALARVETFVRWRHPSLGLLPPGAFISFFETQGRMSELTRYVLAGALAAYSDWRGPYAPGFSINLALSDLSDDAFATHFAKVLRDRDFSADLVTLECPMPPVDLDLDTASAYFARLAETGARLAIEVRGRANDLLRNIDPFPFDEIKTGGSAILRFARTVRGPGLSAISDLLDIASKSNAAITAVGVEDQASLSALRGLGFTAAQGNHLAKVGGLNEFRPGRVNEVRKLLDLEPLSSESLTALFRTQAPAPSSADAAPVDTPAEPGEDSGETREENDRQLVDNLNKRVASEKDAAPVTTAPVDEAKKTRIREKAKALALAKRAKARDVRKAAAIDRAKAKMAHAKQKAQNAKQAEQPAEDAFPPSRDPRDLQEQLNKEFATGDAPKTSSSPDVETREEPTPPETTQATNLPTLDADTPELVTSEIESTEKSERPAAPEDPSEEAKKVFKATADDGKTTPQEKKAAIDNKAKTPTPASEEVQSADSDGPGASPVIEKLSMAVGAARAYFRPGIRVGNPALRSTGALPTELPLQEPDTPEAPAQLALDALAAAEPIDDGINFGVTPDAEDLETELTAAEREPEPEPELKTDVPTQSDLAQSDLAQGDLGHVFENQPAQPNRRKKSQKNFLARRYQLMPTHFWPKSWTRHRRLLAAKRLENSTLPSADEATPAD